MTPAQTTKYWRTWKQACIIQKWDKESTDRKNELRYETHAKAKCPPSMKDFSNSHFSKWLAYMAPSLNDVDIRDRDRENALWSITRLREAIVTVMGADYARAILIDWADTNDVENLPLYNPETHLDLENFRNTLKDRLGRIITRIKNGELESAPFCPAFHGRPNEYIIRHLINREPIKPKARAYVVGPDRVFVPKAKPVDPDLMPF